VGEEEEEEEVKGEEGEEGNRGGRVETGLEQEEEVVEARTRGQTGSSE
jgi:hypothetical protein